jgi:N-glycosidase YbiA
MYYCASFEYDFSYITQKFTNLSVINNLHSSLLHITSKTAKSEQLINKFLDKQCFITIVGYIYNINYVVLDVKEIIVDNIIIPFFVKKLHVTLAHKLNKPTKNSINLFTNKNCTYIAFDKHIIIQGIIKKCNYINMIPSTKNIKFYEPTDLFGCFSNFYNCQIIINDTIYTNSETYYQAEKFKGSHSTSFDIGYSLIIEEQNTANKASSLARQKKSNKPYKWAKELNDIITIHYDNIKIREDWEFIKTNVMRRVVYHKFNQNNKLKTQLLNTTGTITEHTHRDNYWADGSDNNGLNMLGKILEETRYLLGGNISDRYKNMLVFEYSHWVIPGLFLASGAPSNQIHDKMVENGFKVFISLMEPIQEHDKNITYHKQTCHNDFEIINNNITYYRFSIVDRKVTTDDKALHIAKIILNNIANNIPVVLHCWGGKGRVGTIVAIVLGLLYHINGEIALLLTNKLFKNRVNKGKKAIKSPQTNCQFNQVKNIVNMNYYLNFE